MLHNLNVLLGLETCCMVETPTEIGDGNQVDLIDLLETGDKPLAGPLSTPMKSAGVSARIPSTPPDKAAWVASAGKDFVKHVGSGHPAPGPWTAH